MKEIADRDARGQEAPMVIGPRALARLIKAIVDGIRSGAARRSARD